MKVPSRRAPRRRPIGRCHSNPNNNTQTNFDAIFDVPQKRLQTERCDWSTDRALVMCKILDVDVDIRKKLIDNM